jgi:hypothetical protein
VPGACGVEHPSVVDPDSESEVVKLLHDIGGMLMSIDARLEKIVALLGGEDDEEEADA